MKNKFKYLWNNISFATKLFFILYIFFILRLLKNGLQRQTLDIKNLLLLFLGLVTIALFIRIFELLFYKCRFLHILFKIFLFPLYFLISYYHLRSRGTLDFSVVAENAGAAAYFDSWIVIFDIFKTKDLVITLLVTVFLVGLEIYKRKISEVPKFKFRALQLILSIFIYFLIIAFSPYIYDEFASFNQSIYRYYFGKNTFKTPEIFNIKYPYVKNLTHSESENLDKPHIFIIMVESFNHNFVNKKNEENKYYTPFFNSLIKKGLYFDNFWGQSVQTARGQLSIFCSILPITRNKVFTHYPNINLNCISSILKTHGYETLFFKAYEDINFDNTGEFVKRNGFDHVYGMSKEFISDEEKKKYRWGWGVQDNIFYEKFFSYIDELHYSNKLSEKKIFAALTTISNHQKFKKVPKDQRYLYPDQKTKKEFYANSIRVSDEYLKTFFDEFYKRDYLKNSIIIVTADHSFPVGEHFSYAAENGFYNENFKIPFLFIWNGKEDVYNGTQRRAYSQVDIAPSILDILGISAKTHFVGKSFFSEPSKYIHLIQPYGGTYLGVISYPYKYIYHSKTKNEFLFNIEKDPNEEKNLIGNFLDDGLIRDLRQQIGIIYLNDKLIKENRIWQID